jgi:D-sedoheptulose 7-phosphate isomerase
MNFDPVSHFEKLSALTVGTEVTDKTGKMIPLAEGFMNALDKVMREDKKIMVIGNGGSAAIASHFQNDLCKAIGVRALVFYEPSLLTALANDHGYRCIFQRPVELWAENGDLLIAISSSGESENILQAVQTARVKGCEIMTFSGFQAKNSLRRSGDLNFYVPSQSYGEVEVSHMALMHYLTDCAITLRPKERKFATPS